MIAIAESGSTKTEWIILDETTGDILETIKTEGYNPDFHSSQYVANSLNEAKSFDTIKSLIHQIYFYGAGCSSKKLNQKIQDGLELFFKEATIEVEHDLLAAACSIYDGKPIICGILGTGSNSCYYDGKSVHEEIPALGFIVGDEGSGGSIGKQFLADYFYKRLPEEIMADFKSTYNLTWSEARKEIYGSSHSNVYCASFMPFIAKYKENKHVKDLIRESMAKFIEIHINCFSNYESKRVGFVGSIAFFFQDLIKEELSKRGFEFSHVIKNPAMQLVDYHKNYKLNLKPAAKLEHVKSEVNPI